MVAQELGQETAGELLAEEPVQVLACIGELLVARHEQAVVNERDDALQVGHLVGIEGGPHFVAHEQELRLGVVHYVVNLRGMELVEDGHSHSAIGEDAEEGCSPTAQVSAAEGYLVALLDARLLEEDVHLLYYARDIFIL